MRPIEELSNNRWYRWSVVLVALAAIFAIIGPFNTFDRLPLISRFAYWLGIILIAGAHWLTFGWVLRWIVGGQKAWPVVAVDVVSAFTVAIPLAWEIGTINNILFGLPLTYSDMFVTVALSGVLFCLVGHLFRTMFQNQETKPGNAPTPKLSAFHSRIPRDIRGELLCLKTEDHYLRIYTTVGDSLILLRFKDALQELEQENGLQVHRSYWVARRAISEVKIEAGKIRLCLSNGIIVPVSSSYAPDVRLAGWLA